MAKAFNPAGWINGVTIPKVADFQAIAEDLYTLGAPLDAAGHTLANAGAVTLVPGALPGTTYTVTAASWAGGFVTFTIGGNVVGVGQLVTIAGASPAGYNISFGAVTGETSTTITLALASNPGAWVSGGTVTVGAAPGNGTVAVNSSNQVQVYSTATSSWGAATTAVAAGAWHSGSGVPSSGLGSNTDMYINLAAGAGNGNIYGPKTAGAWGAIAGNILGPTGPTGGGSAVGTVFYVLGLQGPIPGADTYYGTVYALSPTEVNCPPTPVPCAGTFANLVVTTLSTQPAGGSLVLTLRRNGASTGITVTIAANAAAGTFTDLTHTQAYSQLDTWDVQVVNGSSSASADIGPVSLQFR